MLPPSPAKYTAKPILYDCVWFLVLRTVLLYYKLLVRVVPQRRATMIRVRVKKTSDVKESLSTEKPEHIKKTEDRLYELHKEIQELEQRKLLLQYRIKALSDKINNLQDRCKPPSQDELFKYCNRLISTSKGKYEDA